MQAHTQNVIRIHLVASWPFMQRGSRTDLEDHLCQERQRQGAQEHRQGQGWMRTRAGAPASRDGAKTKDEQKTMAKKKMNSGSESGDERRQRQRQRQTIISPNPTTATRALAPHPAPRTPHPTPPDSPPGSQLSAACYCRSLDCLCTVWIEPAGQPFCPPTSVLARHVTRSLGWVGRCTQ